jgi:hypothetical protein
MAKSQRDKGLRGEREVRHAFESADFPVRGLEGEGDNLVFGPGGVVFHLETKRQETLRLPEWSRQADREAPAGTLPVVAYRRSRDVWRVSLSLQDFLAVLRLPRG